MSIQVTQLIPSLGIVEAQTAETSSPYLFILRDPEDGEIEIPQDGLISLIVVDLTKSPEITTPYYINCGLDISLDGGENWVSAYLTGSFFAPYNGTSSAVVQHSLSDPFVYNKITIDYTGLYDDSSTVMVRAAASVSGWGHSPWGQFPWGHPSATDVLLEQWSFVIEDKTAPRLIFAEAIDRKICRLTYDDDMRAGTPDGRARVQTGTPGTWDLYVAPLDDPYTLTVVVNGGGTQEIIFQNYMWLDPHAVTADELATALSALVVGGVSAVDGSSGVYIYSDTVGDSSKIKVNGGTSNALFGFETTEKTGSSEGVLDKENYTIERNNVYPAVAVHLDVEEVEFVEGSLTQVDLTFQWEMTPRAPYTVIVDGDVADTSHNDIDPDYKTAQFLGFNPVWPEDRDAEIKMPHSLWEDGDPLDVARAVVNMYQEIEELKITDVDELWDTWNIDVCNDPTVELMLYDAGNPFTDFDLTSIQKRKLVELLPFIYQQKGLSSGLTSTVLVILGIPVTIVSYTADSWRLGIDILGSEYPSNLWSSNAEPFNMIGGGTLNIIIDGGLQQTVTFVDTDFAIPGAASAEEVAIVINDQLTDGGANIFDDGGGRRVEILSFKWGPGASIQVTGGTVASAIGFDTAIVSGGGGCMLAPSSERMQRTFDLEYSTVVPSDEEIEKIRKIAIYMKPVNKHLGRIRAAKIIPTSEYWQLGFDYLGVDTDLGV
ncbi:MAG: hypothetical protein GY841_15475 [FCB group bacterium]|nr:hypothetical protein [FCB group bacterium]